MERVIERCCGLDVHRDTVVACVRVPGAKRVREHHVRTFGTTTAELLTLRDWLDPHGVTHVAMESTGVYLEAGVLRARGKPHMPLGQCGSCQAVPGRKTDVQDCVWIA